MKLQFSRTYILGSAIFLSQLTSGISVAAEPQTPIMTSEEIEEYANDIAENVRKTTVAILCVSPEEQTFENILKPWNRLSAQLVQDLNALDVLGKLRSPSGAVASQISDDLHVYLLRILQTPELHQTLMNCSLHAAHNVKLNPFQRYIGARFVRNDSNEPVYLRGSSEEQNTSVTDFIVLNLKSGPLAPSEISALANIILLENADVVCIQEVLADDHAHDLYEVLESNYAHFIYVPPIVALDFSMSHDEGGVLIASKYRIEQPQFNTFLEEGGNGNEGFLDFVLKNANTTLGHVYATILKKDTLDQTISDKFVQVIEKMQADVLKIAEESIPFVLCGDLNHLQGSQQSKIDLYFGSQDNSSGTNRTLLLETLPAFSSTVNFGTTLSTQSTTLLSNHSGLRTLVKRALSPSTETNSILSPQQSLTAQKIDALAKDKLKITQNAFEIVPIRSHKNRDDDKGGKSCEGGITGRWGDGKGIQWEGYIQGEVHDDKGNYAEARASQKDDGTGKVDIHAGHESQNK